MHLEKDLLEDVLGVGGRPQRQVGGPVDEVLVLLEQQAEGFFVSGLGSGV